MMLAHRTNVDSCNQIHVYFPTQRAKLTIIPKIKTRTPSAYYESKTKVVPGPCIKHFLFFNKSKVIHLYNDNQDANGIDVYTKQVKQKQKKGLYWSLQPTTHEFSSRTKKFHQRCTDNTCANGIDVPSRSNIKQPNMIPAI